MESNKTVLSERYTLTLFKDRTHLNSKRGKSSFEYEKRKAILAFKPQHLMQMRPMRSLIDTIFMKVIFSLNIDGNDTDSMQGTFYHAQDLY